MYSDDTIAAISTPSGRGGIGVVRLSGPAALEIATSFCKLQTPLDNPNLAQFARIVDPDTEEVIDEIVVTFFKAPRSFTGEDVIELSCHGSPVILGRVLQMTTERGARIAEPGEFTFRAFINKRIDLVQAQAVRDIINAQTQYQAHIAAKQLGGGLSLRLTPLKDAVVEVIVHLETSVEFVEEDIAPETAAMLSSRLDGVIKALKQTANTFSFGHYVKEGFDLAIVGRSNVGKSSVFNRLIGNDRAIVTDLPGTTRDALYQDTSIAGVPVRLIDTAGIRHTTDKVENIGIGRTRAAIADAEISLLVLDGSAPLHKDDLELLESVSETRRIIALNKNDLSTFLDEQWTKEVGDRFVDWAENVVNISALTGSGFDELTAKIFEKLSGDSAAERDDIMLTDARQHAGIRSAISQLSDARSLLNQGELEEIVLLRLRGALAALGEITGETLTDDILGQIFSTFCIGK